MSDVLVLNADGNPLCMNPLSSVSWQTAISLVIRGRAKVLKDHEDWVVRSPSTTMHVPSVIITTKFAKWDRQVKYNKTNVYLRDGYKCQYCHKKFLVSKLTIDHVIPKSHGGKTNWKNVVTACRDCNSKKGNNPSVVPNEKPHRPSYYELIAMRKNHPVYIRDEYWKTYLDWPEENIILHKYKPKRS